MPDYYEVLQVDHRADPEVVRAAYRALARKYHPDHGGDPTRMIALNDAWDVLGDPARRAAYDAERAQLVNLPPAEAAARPGSGTQPAPAAPHAGPPPAPAGSHAGTQPAPAASHAGPPPGRPAGTVLDFGRYAGWSLGEIARHDMDYLEWLQRATFGRRLRAEIEALLAQSRRPGVSHRAPSGHAWKGRR
ncbi:MAG: J domain-containing protein [Candidatus Limnocylindrales bacterium]|jgi:curved DNA-binding protein CbpA